MELQNIINSLLLKFGVTIFHIIVSIVIFLILKKVITVFGHKIIKDRTKRTQKQRFETLISLYDDFVKYVLNIILTLVIIVDLGVEPAVLLASVGAFSVIIGLAAQSLIGDMINGFFTVVEGYYDVGDYIMVNDFEGEVLSLGIKTTTILDPENKVVTIPNSQIKEVTNYSKYDYINYIDFGFGYDMEIDVVKKIVEEEIFPILGKNIDVINLEYLGINNLETSDIKATVAITSHAKNRHYLRRNFNSLMKIHFDKNEITIPYNQLVVHNI